MLRRAIPELSALKITNSIYKILIQTYEQEAHLIQLKKLSGILQESLYQQLSPDFLLLGKGLITS